MLQARRARAEGRGDQTLTLMRDVLSHALRRNSSRFRLAIAFLVVALLGTSAFGFWKLSALKREKLTIDARIRQIEILLEKDETPQEAERLISELSTYQDEARSLERSVLYRYAVRQQQNFITNEIRTIMAEFGAETYSVPPEFEQGVNSIYRTIPGARPPVDGAGAQPGRQQANRNSGDAGRGKAAARSGVYTAGGERAGAEAGECRRSGRPWQLTATTARALGLRVDGAVDERLDLRKATRAGCRYLRNLILDFGSGSSVMLALAAYNLGPTRVKQAVVKVVRTPSSSGISGTSTGPGRCRRRRASTFPRCSPPSSSGVIRRGSDFSGVADLREQLKRGALPPPAGGSFGGNLSAVSRISQHTDGTRPTNLAAEPVFRPRAHSGRPVARAQQQDKATFSTGVKVVNLFANVRNKNGAIVKDLTKDDFLLDEDGRTQVIRYFSQESDLPLTLGLLVDTSGSQRRLIEEERSASYRFFEQVLRPEKDVAFVIHFDFDVELLQDITRPAGCWKRRWKIWKRPPSRGNNVIAPAAGPVPISRRRRARSRRVGRPGGGGAAAAEPCYTMRSCWRPTNSCANRAAARR